MWKVNKQVNDLSFAIKDLQMDRKVYTHVETDSKTYIETGRQTYVQKVRRTDRQLDVSTDR